MHRGREPGQRPLAEAARSVLDRGARRRRGRGARGRRAHVAGFSMGGYIAQTLALRHPSSSSGSVLVCTGTGGRDFLQTPEETDRGLAGERRPDAAGVRHARRCRCRSGPAGRTSTRTSSSSCSPTGSSIRRRRECWRAQYDACLDWAARVTPVEQIEAPTLVVHGDADRVVPYENGVEVARRTPGLSLRDLRGAGHLLFLEDAPALQRDGHVVPDWIESRSWTFATRPRRPRSAPSCARGSSRT